MKPGTYTMTIYKKELAVWTGSVTVTAGNATTVHTVTPTDPSGVATIWRIGDWDGTPLEFKYAVQQYEGFSDVVSFFGADNRWSWAPMTFAVGSAASSFPAYEYRDENSPITITFNLTAAQVAAHTVDDWHHLRPTRRPSANHRQFLDLAGARQFHATLRPKSGRRHLSWE